MHTECSRLGVAARRAVALQCAASPERRGFAKPPPGKHGELNEFAVRCAGHEALLAQGVAVGGAVMRPMSNDRFNAVLGVQSVDEFRGELLRFTKWLGFDLVSAVVVIDRPQGEPEFLPVGNTPDAYRQVADDRDAGRMDPVMQHCKHHSTPIIWDQQIYVKVGRPEMWEEQAAYGYRTGICFAQHLPAGRHFVVGVDRDQALPRSLVERQRMAAQLCLFAAYAQQAALRWLVPQRVAEPRVQFSPRELEALRWTMEGKTAWEVGAILGISEQTATRHIFSAVRKLGCVNKVQPVAKALQTGLIA